MALKKYQIEDLFFPGFVTYRNAEWIDISVGGDRGDVKIECAGPVVERGEDGEDVDGISCTGVELHSTEDFTEEEAREIAEGVIRIAYESIKGDTFIGKGRA